MTVDDAYVLGCNTWRAWTDFKLAEPQCLCPHFRVSPLRSCAKHVCFLVARYQQPELDDAPRTVCAPCEEYLRALAALALAVLAEPAC